MYGGPSFKKHFITGLGFIQDALEVQGNFEWFAVSLESTALGKKEELWRDITDLILNWNNK